MISENTKKALFYFGVALIVFWVIKPKSRKSFEIGKNDMSEPDPKDREKITAPTMSAKDAKKNPIAAKAFTALRAYVEAYNAGEPQSALDELNELTGKEIGMKVYRRRGDNKLVVKDMSGKDIIVNN